MNRSTAIAAAAAEFSKEALAQRGRDGFPLFYIRNKYKGCIRAGIAKALDTWLAQALSLHLSGLIDDNVLAGIKTALRIQLMHGVQSYRGGKKK